MNVTNGAHTNNGTAMVVATMIVMTEEESHAAWDEMGLPHCRECNSYDCGAPECCPNGLVHRPECSQAHESKA